MNALAKASAATPNAVRVREDRIRAEAWFSRHLWDMTGVNIQAGITDAKQRADRIRQVLIDKGMTERTMGRFNGKPETYSQFVKRALGIDVAQKSLF